MACSIRTYIPSLIAEGRGRSLGERRAYMYVCVCGCVEIVDYRIRGLNRETSPQKTGPAFEVGSSFNRD